MEKGIRPRQVWSGSILLKSLDSERSPVKGRTQLQYAQDMAKLSLRKYNALNVNYTFFYGSITILQYIVIFFVFVGTFSFRKRMLEWIML